MREMTPLLIFFGYCLAIANCMLIEKPENSSKYIKPLLEVSLNNNTSEPVESRIRGRTIHQTAWSTEERSSDEINTAQKTSNADDQNETKKSWTMNSVLKYLFNLLSLTTASDQKAPAFNSTDESNVNQSKRNKKSKIKSEDIASSDQLLEQILSLSEYDESEAFLNILSSAINDGRLKSTSKNSDGAKENNLIFQKKINEKGTISYEKVNQESSEKFRKISKEDSKRNEATWANDDEDSEEKDDNIIAKDLGNVKDDDNDKYDDKENYDSNNDDDDDKPADDDDEVEKVNDSNNDNDDVKTSNNESYDENDEEDDDDDDEVRNDEDDKYNDDNAYNKDNTINSKETSQSTDIYIREIIKFNSNSRRNNKLKIKPKTFTKEITPKKRNAGRVQKSAIKYISNSEHNKQRILAAQKRKNQSIQKHNQYHRKGNIFLTSNKPHTKTTNRQSKDQTPSRILNASKNSFLHNQLRQSKTSRNNERAPKYSEKFESSHSAMPRLHKAKNTIPKRNGNIKNIATSKTKLGEITSSKVNVKRNLQKNILNKSKTGISNESKVTLSANERYGSSTSSVTEESVNDVSHSKETVKTQKPISKDFNQDKRGKYFGYLQKNNEIQKLMLNGKLSSIISDLSDSSKDFEFSNENNVQTDTETTKNEEKNFKADTIKNENYEVIASTRNTATNELSDFTEETRAHKEAKSKASISTKPLVDKTPQKDNEKILNKKNKETKKLTSRKCSEGSKDIKVRNKGKISNDLLKESEETNIVKRTKIGLESNEKSVKINGFSDIAEEKNKDTSIATDNDAHISLVNVEGISKKDINMKMEENLKIPNEENSFKKDAFDKTNELDLLKKSSESKAKNAKNIKRQRSENTFDADKTVKNINIIDRSFSNSSYVKNGEIQKSTKFSEKSNVDLENSKVDQNIQMSSYGLEESFKKEDAHSKQSSGLQSYSENFQSQKVKKDGAEESFETILEYVYKHSSSSFFKTLREEGKFKK